MKNLMFPQKQASNAVLHRKAMQAAVKPKSRTAAHRPPCRKRGCVK